MLHDDLIDQASTLLNHDERKPKQANLRRCISTAYYAVFHALGYELSRQIIGSRPADGDLRGLVRRALQHSEMKSALAGFANSNINQIYKPALTEAAPPVALQKIAATFIYLQSLRHTADYDLTLAFSKADAQSALNRATKALSLLQGLRTNHSPSLKVFFLSLILHTKLKGRV